MEQNATQQAFNFKITYNQDTIVDLDEPDSVQLPVNNKLMSTDLDIEAINTENYIVNYHNHNIITGRKNLHSKIKCKDNFMVSDLTIKLLPIDDLTNTKWVLNDLISNTSPYYSSLTTLNSSKWILNETVDFPINTDVFNLRFYCTNYNADITITGDGIYFDSDDNCIYYDEVDDPVYTATDGWSDLLYRNIFLSSGSDIDSPNAIDWFYNNAIIDKYNSTNLKLNFKVPISEFDPDIFYAYGLNSPETWDDVIDCTILMLENDFGATNIESTLHVEDYKGNWVNLISSGVDFLYHDGDLYSDQIYYSIYSSGEYIDPEGNLPVVTGQLVFTIDESEYIFTPLDVLGFFEQYGGLYYGGYYDYYPNTNTGVYSKNGFKTWEITGGDSVNDPLLINWLIENATPIQTYDYTFTQGICQINNAPYTFENGVITI